MIAAMMKMILRLKRRISHLPPQKCDCNVLVLPRVVRHLLPVDLLLNCTCPGYAAFLHDIVQHDPLILTC